MVKIILATRSRTRDYLIVLEYFIWILLAKSVGNRICCQNYLFTLCACILVNHVAGQSILFFLLKYNEIFEIKQVAFACEQSDIFVLTKEKGDFFVLLD